MANTGEVTVQGSGLVGAPGDRIVQAEDGTLRLIKAADIEQDVDDPCEDEDE